MTTPLRLLPSARARFALLAILALHSATAAPTPAIPGAARATVADDDLVPFVPRPLTLADIIARHGPPCQRIGADLWVYWHVLPPDVAAARGGFDTLIVHFEGEAVKTVKYVRPDALRALLLRLGNGRAHPAAAGAATPG